MAGPILDGDLVREAPWRVFARSEPIDVPLLVGANSNEASVILAMGVPPSAALAYLGRDQAAGRAAYGMGLADDELADRQSVVSGKRVSVRVDLGGRRIIKKKKSTQAYMMNLPDEMT